MQKIEAFLKEKSSLAPKKGLKGVFSDWLPYTILELKGDALQFVETRVLGLRGNDNDECIEIVAEPGKYEIECRGVRFESDVRIAGMRVFPVGIACARGKRLGKIPVDLGGIAIVDISVFEPSILENKEDYEEWLETIIFEGDCESLIATHLWMPTNTRIVAADGGFGDGVYEVYSLINNGKTVGLEVEFIEEGSYYPFEMD